MKKTIALGIVFLFVVMSFSSISGNQINENIIIPSYKGDILYVGGSGPNNYTTIQSAINGASGGDTVFVFDDSSPYFETINVYRYIDLIGEDRNTTIIKGSIMVTHNNVKISCFTINSNSEYCIEILSSNNIFSDNIINSEVDGIYITASPYDNIFNNLISHNIINSRRHGIILYSAGFEGCNDNIIANNIIISTEDKSGNGIKILSLDGDLVWSFCENNKVSYNIIKNFRNGIYLDNEYTDDTKIFGNTISNNYIGIYADWSGSCQMTNNIISDNCKGIFLVCIGSPTDVIGNLFENNKQIGLRFWSSRPQDSILQNNFINNRRHASFVSALWLNGFTYNWRGNYWGEPKSEPFRIWGRFVIPFPWINYDNYPAQEPYNYTTTQVCGIE